jgi:hypothetical protein
MSGGREHERMWQQVGGWHGQTWWIGGKPRNDFWIERIYGPVFAEQGNFT